MCVCVCLYLKISINAESIWFTFTNKHPLYNLPGLSVYRQCSDGHLNDRKMIISRVKFYRAMSTYSTSQLAGQSVCNSLEATHFYRQPVSIVFSISREDFITLASIQVLYDLQHTTINN